MPNFKDCQNKDRVNIRTRAYQSDRHGLLYRLCRGTAVPPSTVLEEGKFEELPRYGVWEAKAAAGRGCKIHVVDHSHGIFAGRLGHHTDTGEESDDAGWTWRQGMQDSGTGCRKHWLALEAGALHRVDILGEGNTEVESDAATG